MDATSWVQGLVGCRAAICKQIRKARGVWECYEALVAARKDTGEMSGLTEDPSPYTELASLLHCLRELKRQLACHQGQGGPC